MDKIQKFIENFSYINQLAKFREFPLQPIRFQISVPNLVWISGANTKRVLSCQMREEVLLKVARTILNGRLDIPTILCPWTGSMLTKRNYVIAKNVDLKWLISRHYDIFHQQDTTWLIETTSRMLTKGHDTLAGTAVMKREISVPIALFFSFSGHQIRCSSRKAKKLSSEALLRLKVGSRCTSWLKKSNFQ